jgi:hypothetical protein
MKGSIETTGSRVPTTSRISGISKNSGQMPKPSRRKWVNALKFSFSKGNIEDF